MGVFDWNLPSNQLSDSRVGCKSGIGDENHKQARKNDGSVTSSWQDVDHTGLSGSRSQSDLESGSFSSQDDKLPRQAVNP